MLKAIQLPPSIYLITYYHTLGEVSWLLRQEKIKNTKVLKKHEKNANFIKKLLKVERLKQIH